MVLVGDPAAVRCGLGVGLSGLVLRVTRAGAPAGHYRAGSGTEKLVVLACRFLPPAAVESLAARHFRLAG